MKITLPEEFESLPAWIIDTAVFHAQCHAEDVLGIKRDSPKFPRAVEKEATRFLDEYLVEAQGHPARQNPTTPKDITTFTEFQDTYFKGEGSFLGKKADSEEKRKRFEIMLRGAINTIALIYLELGMGLKIHQKKNLGVSDVEGFSDMEFAGRRGEEVRQVTVNRIYRTFIATSIMTMLEPIFSTDGTKIKAMIDDAVKSISGKDLASTSYRLEFAHRVRETIQDAGFNLEAIRKSL